MIVIIMAGGLGKRMQSKTPKVLHKIDGIPMIIRIIKESKKLNPNKILIVVGKYMEIIMDTINNYDIITDNIKYIYQEFSQGTGHAIMCCRDYLMTNLSIKSDDDVLIMSGDVPLISIDTMRQMLENYSKIRIMSVILEDPHGHGRIIRDKNNKFYKIIEEKDCNKSEKNTKEASCGIYVFNKSILCNYLPYINNNNKQHEYYLPDIIEIIMKNEKFDIDIFVLSDEKQHEIINVNTQLDLQLAEKIVKKNDE